MSREAKRWGMLTYSRCQEILGNRQRKRLAPNTYLKSWGERLPGEPKERTVYEVILYTTMIIRIKDNGSNRGRITISTGGYKTVTTKQRINALSPVYVSQRDGQWYVGDKVFTDGMEV